MKKNNLRKGKRRVAFWLDPQIARKLLLEAKEKGITRQSIVESVLRDRLNSISREDSDALIIRRLNKQDTSLLRLEEKIDTFAEAFAMFLRMWLMSNQEVPECQKEAAVMQARERYDRYLKAVGKRLRTGQSIFEELPREVMEGERVLNKES